MQSNSAQPTSGSPRWELYRLLGEPARLKLLALAGADELSIGELAELLGESQPNVSRHVSPLRKAGLLGERKHGTRVFVSLDEQAAKDPVVADAVAAGRALCQEDGSLARVAELVRKRDEVVRAFFGKPRASEPELSSLPSELPAYLTAIATLLPHRDLAVDAGTGDGTLLDALAPVFGRVVAIDREEAQLARAKERLGRRGYTHVELVHGDVAEAGVRAKVGKVAHRLGLDGADVVFAARVLHHAARPADLVKAFAELVRPGGALVVLDYAPHDDESLRDGQADVWLGFSEPELVRLGRAAGLEDARVHPIPTSRNGVGPDAHVAWQVLTARKPKKKH